MSLRTLVPHFFLSLNSRHSFNSCLLATCKHTDMGKKKAHRDTLILQGKLKWEILNAIPEIHWQKAANENYYNEYKIIIKLSHF